MDNIRKKALAGLVVASILWSTGGLFIKLISWNPIAIAGGRSGIAALVMLIYLRKPVRSFEKVKLLGAISYASTVMLFVTANKLTTSANAILLQFTAPVWVLLFSRYILKERIRRYDILAICTVLGGMTMFLVGELGSGNMLGNFLAVMSGIALAGVVVLLKLQKESSPVEMTLLGNIITFVVSIPFFRGEVPTMRNISSIIFLGVMQLGISYILYANSIRYVSSIEAILIPVIEPLLNPVWVFIFTGELPGMYALLGGTIVVASVIIREIKAQRLNILKT